MKRYLALLAACGLFLGACGDDDTAATDESADDEPADDQTSDEPADDEPADDEPAAGGDLVSAIAASLEEPDQPGDPVPTADEARCAAEEIVGAIGEDRLSGLGVTPDNVPDELSEVGFEPDEVETVVNLQFECYDFERLLTESFATSGISQDGASCLAAAIPDDAIIAAGIAEGTGDEAAEEQANDELFSHFSSAAPDCLTAEELALVGLG